MSLTNEQKSPLDGIQKNWTEPVYVETAQDLISRMDDKNSNFFNAHQDKLIGVSIAERRSLQEPGSEI